ncbi:MAG: glycosyltransferase [Flavobacteriales bacterium]|nr:glycosyltransferase [Flavobacteriales bacterium]MCB9193633.1 glycosyltransferase [Flavobacteriales bacterium]
MTEPRVAIISPNRSAWSETFVRAHIERLPGVKLVLMDDHLPRRDADGAPLLSDTLRARLVRRVRGIGPESALRRAVTERLRRARIEVVFAEYGPTGDAMLPICRELDIPLVVQFHGVDAYHEKLLREHDGYTALLKGAAAILVVSREMQSHVIALGADPSKVVHNVCGIDLDRFRPGRPEQADKTFLFVGRFVDKKAPQLVVLAFARALESDQWLRLRMLGDGPLLESVRQMIGALGIEGSVELLGVGSPDEVAAEMARSRALVQHSVTTASGDREGTPVAVMEAMAAGLPVIATRHAGIADVVVHETSGLLCEERSIDVMAGHMVRLAAKPDHAARMGAEGRRIAERDLRLDDRIDTIHRTLLRAVGR